jgi:hypothetical protein
VTGSSISGTCASTSRSGCRCRASSATGLRHPGDRYFYFYETESLDTLQSPAYLARLADPTPWTRRTIPLVRNNKRTACRVVASVGPGLGGVIATLQLGPRPGHEEELRAWLTGSALLVAVEHPGIVAATCWRATRA